MGFQAVIKSAASAASPETRRPLKKSKDQCFVTFLGPLYRDLYRDFGTLVADQSTEASRHLRAEGTNAGTKQKGGIHSVITEKPIEKADWSLFFHIFWGLVPGFVSWVLGIVFWVLGFVF